MTYNILIADNRFDSYAIEQSVLSQIDCRVMIEKSNDENILTERVNDIDGMIVNLAPVTKRIISQMHHCRCISRYGVGYDNIDAKTLKAQGIYLANVPDYCDEDVSDHALALWLDCVRKVSLKDKLIREGQWNLSRYHHSQRICGKVFGFIGFGSIAGCFRRKLLGFHLGRVLVYDPYLNQMASDKKGVEQTNLKDLCARADYISVHAPLTPETQGMINRELFSIMKKNAIIINTSRGGVINEADLVEALQTRRIACAGLDVFSMEPLPETSLLRRLDNVVLSDHEGWYSEESVVELKTKAAQNIVDTFVVGKPRYMVELK
ncbi:MAG: C-terminal binding protein [Sedimentisphaerales bacterium]|nr:C-terminal binding protein [Sedimentisphaerales bacterium]